MNPVIYKAFYILQRNLYWLLLLGFLLMLFGYMSTVIHNQQVQLDYSKAVTTEMENKLNGVSNILSQKENELGQQTTKVEAISGEKKQLELYLHTQDKYLTGRLSQMDIKLKDLHSVTSLNVTTSGEFATITKDSIIEKIVYKYVGDSLKKDTVRQAFKVINYREPKGWFEMNGSIHGDTMKFNPVFYEQYEVLLHEERKPKRYLFDFFRRKQTVGTVFSKNPYTRSNEVKVIVQKKQRKKLFSLF